MKTRIKKKQTGVVELTVELEKEELARYIKSVQSELGDTVAVKGFRKGKAPGDVLEKHLDKDRVRELALQQAVSASLEDAVKENNFDVADTAELNVRENTSDKLVYSVVLSLYPAMTFPPLSQFKIPRKPVHVEEKELNEAIDVVRNMRAQFIEKDQTAQTGDRVEIDFEAFLDGKLIDGGESKNHPLIIGGKAFVPGFEEQLAGMKSGEKKEFQLKVPEDYAHKQIAGKKLDFKVTVNKVQSVKLPDLNDAFVQGLGAFKDLDHFRTNIREGLKKEKEEKEKERVRLEALEAIAAKTKIDVPGFLIEEQLDGMIAGFDRDLHEKGLELGLYLARMGKSQEDLRKDWQKNAEKQACFALIVRATAKQNNISAAPQEVEEAFNQTIQMFAARGQADLGNIDTQALRGRIADRMVNEKALELIEKSCVV